MYIIEKGVLPDSSILFYTPSQLAKSLFFYPISMGYFLCDHNYHVTRKEHQSYLLLYVIKDSGTVISGNQTYTLDEGCLLFLDCYKQHTYFTSSWEIAWLHFDGNISAQYYNLIIERFGSIINANTPTSISRLLLDFIDYFSTQSSINEALVSCQINQLLCELFTLSSHLSTNELHTLSPVDHAIEYMKVHFKEPITLEDLAYQVTLSPYYFTRLFKKETGRTPYDYLITLRINQSKYLLKSTSMLVKEIAFEVGFNSESNFMSSFKKVTGYTPTAFRTLPL
ncbi:helix-turn-helix transcriptional regulator [Niameybacter massiliensis]|uniref:helix-turn-helix transcriptional regulator n=1 Tax=Niameybacter massiliensis TaxID=1658108 RepID=UPI0006B47B3D|nr:AraC family transcriptional regulator [Niameybacter massiliensis]